MERCAGKIRPLTNGRVSFPVVRVRVKMREGESDRVRTCLREREREKRLIHTAGAVVSSPAFLALAPVGSDTAAVHTLPGAASWGLEKHLIINRPGFVGSSLEIKRYQGWAIKQYQ